MQFRFLAVKSYLPFYLVCSLSFVLDQSTFLFRFALKEALWINSI